MTRPGAPSLDGTTGLGGCGTGLEGCVTGLEGNGVALVRERALAKSVQHALERLYQVERVADVEDYVAAATDGERETLLVREAEDGALEISLRLPPLGAREVTVGDAAGLDPMCQLIEGVSHFVYVTHRASADRSTTHLEMELQAEVDKYVVLVSALDVASSTDAASGVHASRAVRESLFQRVRFTHDEDSEHGTRYRLANAAADRFTAHLESAYVSARRFHELRSELRRFFRMGQEEKLRVAR